MDQDRGICRCHFFDEKRWKHDQCSLPTSPQGDPTGEAHWLNALGNDSLGNATHVPTLAHSQVINDFLFSSESLGRLVEGDYEVLLQRQADPAEVNHWVTELQGGLTYR